VGQIDLRTGANELPLGFTAMAWVGPNKAQWHVMLLRDGRDCGSFTGTKESCDAFAEGFIVGQTLAGRPLREAQVGATGREHRLKTAFDAFQAVLDGRKPFEFRLNDRDFQVGDTLILCELQPSGSDWTGRIVEALVTYIAKDRFGIPPGYCVMGISVIR
jgi:hypothetical protein